MRILRVILLLAVAASGIGLVADTLLHSPFRFELTAGVGFFVAAVVIAALVFHAIGKGTMPFRCWYLVPVILGVGVGLLGGYNLRGFLSDVSAFSLGVGAALVSFAALQFWADRQGRRDWYGLAVLAAIVLVNGAAGAFFWYGG